MRILTTSVSRLLIPLLALAFIAGCANDDGGDDDTPTVAATSTSEATATATDPPPTAEATLPASPTPDPALDIVSGPQHFLYVVADGDTLDAIAARFDAATGDGGFLDASELAELNDVEDADLEPGQLLAIPVRLPAVGAIMPENTIQEALGGDDPGAIDLLVPSQEMVDGFLGRIALYRVMLDTDESAPGYVMEYWYTDRPGFRAGEIDEDAVFDSPAFTVAAGPPVSLEPEDADDSTTWERDGVPYALHATVIEDITAADLAAMLITPAERE